jgi:hypothetical protein
MRQFFGTPTGWIVVVCLIGSLACFLPWEQTTHLGKTLPDQTKYGVRIWRGKLAIGMFLGLEILALATGLQTPPPAWRPYPTLAAGLFVLIAGIAVMIDAGSATSGSSLGQNATLARLGAQQLSVSASFGAYIAVALSLALLGLSGWQVRDGLAQPKLARRR